jgi:hypothetical protein
MTPKRRHVRTVKWSCVKRDPLGYLIYDGKTAEIAMEDRALAHLQIVIINKIRRQESFAFSWKDPASAGDGRSTIWIHPTVSLRFRFLGGRPPVINHTWIAALTQSANSSTGLHMIPEPIDHSSAVRVTEAH